MSRTRFAATVLTAVLAGWASSASAADTEFGRSGPYLGGGGIYAFESFNVDDYSPDGSWGYELKGGYRFNEWFALEVDWEHLLSFDDSDYSNGETKQYLASVNGKVYPFHGIIQPYALVGVGYSNVNDTHLINKDADTGVGFLFAGGVDIYVHRNFGFYAQAGYILPTETDYGAIPINFGLFYRFY